MKHLRILLPLLAIALASCNGGTSSSSGISSSEASSDSQSTSSEQSSSEESSESSSTSSEAEIPVEIADIDALGRHLYKETAKASNAYTYNENGSEARYSFSTREMLISRGETSFSYEGLIGGYYREISTGGSASATKVNEASEGESTAYWQNWIDSKITYNSLANLNNQEKKFGVNSVARPFGRYDAETDSLTGTSTTKTYRAGAVSSGYRVYLESYLETGNSEIFIYQNYEITCDVYLTSDLVPTSISTSFRRASDSNWDKESHSIIDASSLITSSFAISDISWGEIPAYDDDDPLVDFAPYYMTSLTDIDIVDTEAGWHGENGNPKQGDYYSMPNDADKMSFLPESALDYAEVDITSVYPSGALTVGVGYGQFIYSGEVQITFGTPTNPSLMTKTYNVTADESFNLVPPVISAFEGNLEADPEAADTYSSSITVGGSAYYTGLTSQGTSVNLDLRQLTCSYDEELISVSYETSSNMSSKTVLFTVTGLKAGTGSLVITGPSSTSSGAEPRSHTINITVTE